MGNHKLIFLILILAALLPLLAYGGTTGKIAGRVIDKETRQGLPGVNVIIEGTTLGAATDANGNFIILMVPPGIYTVRAMMIGYSNFRYENVKVSVDLTTKLEIELTTTILDVGEEVTVVAERPLIQMDLTSTSAVVGSETIARLPVDHFADVVNLQAGVVEGHFRGGRAGEVMYMIDGIPVNDAYSGTYAFQVENSAIAELEVISGTFNAEYGQAMSGVVNIVTKEGGKNYSGEFSTYLGDYLSDHKNIFWNIDKLNPTYNFEASLSGPVPGMKDKLSFYINGRWFDTDGYIYGKKVFVPSDQSDFSAPNSSDWKIMSQGQVYNYSKEIAQDLINKAKPVPMNPEKRVTGLMKLTYTFSPSDKLSYELLVQDQFYKNYDHRFRLNPDGDYKRFNNGFNNNLIWTHVLSQRTFFTVKTNYFLTKYKQYVYEDPFDPRYVSLRRLQDAGANAFLSGGMQMWNFRRSTNTLLSKFDITSQVTNSHQFKLGVEAKRHRLWLHEFEVITDGAERIPPPSAFNNNRYTHYPTEFSAYIQDKMEFTDLIVNAGVRFDYFNPDGEVPLDYSNPTASAKKRANASAQFSPRFGLAYPITSRGVIHVSYGHFFQTPNLDYLYVNPEFELFLLQSTVSPPPNSTLNTLGNASLKPQKTVIYEIGLQQQLSDQFALDVTAYRKDIRNLLGTEVLRLFTGGYYARYINRDYANVKGITVSLEKRQTAGITGVGASVDYTYQVAKGNASDPNDAYLNTLSGLETLKQMRPLDWDRQHQINATLTIGDPSSYNVSLIGRLATGFPYTSVWGTGAYIENNARRPLIYTFDMYLIKNFKLGRLSYSLFARIFNLFDRLNERDVFPDTGRAGYSLTPYHMGYLQPRGINSLEDYFIRPDFYSSPREVQVGLTVGF
ncbi:MAG: TonB-dependent receptor [candidate division KSB1 bacterium]|nr:TonB-dependent receptor [candidate division KSB1 bacterium]